MVKVALDRVSLCALRLFSANYYFVNVRYNFFFIHGSSGPSLKSIPNLKIKWVPRAFTHCLKQLEVNLTTYIYCRSWQCSFIHLYSALEAGLAGNRAQSCDRYGSGTLHPGQVLGGSLPLLSPAFRRSHFRRQVPVRPQRRERS